eukprot:5408643-Pleurochrysis_carterae.AAC.1
MCLCLSGRQNARHKVGMRQKGGLVRAVRNGGYGAGHQASEEGAAKQACGTRETNGPYEANTPSSVRETKNGA